MNYERPDSVVNFLLDWQHGRQSAKLMADLADILESDQRTPEYVAFKIVETALYDRLSRSDASSVVLPYDIFKGFLDYLALRQQIPSDVEEFVHMGTRYRRGPRIINGRIEK